MSFAVIENAEFMKYVDSADDDHANRDNEELST
jgi:hypothetical protein